MARKPATLSHLETASIPLVGTVAWEALINHSQLQAGETVLIHGAAGGVGSLALQIAKAVGATALATCRPHHRAFVQSLGADATIDYTQKAKTAAKPDVHQLLCPRVHPMTHATSFAPSFPFSKACEKTLLARLFDRMRLFKKSWRRSMLRVTVDNHRLPQPS